MAKDPICGMYVDEKTAEFKVTVRGITYYFCSQTCMKEFMAPEVEIKRLKISVVVGAILSASILFLTYVSFLPMSINKRARAPNKPALNPRIRKGPKWP